MTFVTGSLGTLALHFPHHPEWVKVVTVKSAKHVKDRSCTQWRSDKVTEVTITTSELTFQRPFVKHELCTGRIPGLAD